MISLSGVQILDRITNEPICAPIETEIRAGDLVLLTGPNGVGKSSLLNVLRNVLRHTPRNLQSSRNPDQLTATPFRGSIRASSLDVILEVIHHPQLSSARFALPLTLRDVRDLETDRELDVNEPLLRGLDLTRPWDTASGGEKQRVILSTTFASASVSGGTSGRTFGDTTKNTASLLLLDEPTNHLDRKARELIADEIVRWVHEPNATRAALVVTHETSIFESKTSTKIIEMLGAN